MLLPLTHKRSVQMWHKKRQGEAARLEFTLLLSWEVYHYHHVSGPRLQGQAMSEPWCLMTLMRKPVLLMTSVKKPWLPVHLVSASRDSDEWPMLPLQLMATNDLLDHQLPQDLKGRFKLADIHGIAFNPLYWPRLLWVTVQSHYILGCFVMEWKLIGKITWENCLSEFTTPIPHYLEISLLEIINTMNKNVHSSTIHYSPKTKLPIKNIINKQQSHNGTGHRNKMNKLLVVTEHM